MGVWRAALLGMQHLVRAVVYRTSFKPGDYRICCGVGCGDVGAVLSSGDHRVLLVRPGGRPDEEVLVAVAADKLPFLTEKCSPALLSRPVVLEESLCELLASLMMKQLSEKLDAVREVAGGGLMHLLKLKLKLREQRLLEECLGGGVNWARPDEVFPRVGNLLAASQVHFHYLVQGVVISVGGLTESVSKEATRALVGKCFSRSNEEVLFSLTGCTSSVYGRKGEEAFRGLQDPSLINNRLSHVVLDMFVANRRLNRVILPLLKTLQVLLGGGVMQHLACYDGEAAWGRTLLRNIAEETYRCTNVRKMCMLLDLLSQLLAFEGQVRYLAFVQLVQQLNNQYPRVRKCVILLIITNALHQSSNRYYIITND